MSFEQWSVYNHALIPNVAPNIVPNLSDLDNPEIWKREHPLFARWVTDWDCGTETDWWYVIKDEKFDISELKSKRRYEINKGRRNFLVKRINASEFKEQIYEIQVDAYSDYPVKYRPCVIKHEFFEFIESWEQNVVFGAFSSTTEELVGYARLNQVNERFIEFLVLKSKPEFEKQGVNAAIVDGILCFLNEFLTERGILCDGSRNIKHETNFQEYLIKYFGFRKAYCFLNIKYRKPVDFVIKVLYPFRTLLQKMDSNRIIHLVNGVMTMDNIVRNQKRRK